MTLKLYLYLDFVIFIEKQLQYIYIFLTANELKKKNLLSLSHEIVNHATPCDYGD